jgi:hypothetical protein
MVFLIGEKFNETYGSTATCWKQGSIRGIRGIDVNPMRFLTRGLFGEHNTMMSHNFGMIFTRMRQNTNKIYGVLRQVMSFSCNRIIINKIRGV